MSYSKEYWLNRWDVKYNSNGYEMFDSMGFGDATIPQERETYAVIELLAEYCSLNKSAAWVGVSLSAFGRFFKGHWNHHHSRAVEKTISNYYFVDGFARLSGPCHHADFILAQLKENISSHISPNGDLQRILEVIFEKIGVNYFQLDKTSEDLLHQYGDNPKLQNTYNHSSERGFKP
jgi:hypothetical protein